MSSLVLTGNTSGTVTLAAPAVAGTNTLTLPASTGSVIASDASANIQFNSGFGSVATAYGCRAWVNFNGTGTVAIRASGNVTSITDNGVGDYTVNFTTAMPDANYSANISIERDTTTTANVRTCAGYTGGRSTTSFRLVTEYSGTSGTLVDIPAVYVAIFR